MVMISLNTRSSCGLLNYFTAPSSQHEYLSAYCIWVSEEHDWVV